MDKSSARKIVKEKLLEQKEFLEKKSWMITSLLLELDVVKNARSISIYNSLDKEVNTKAIIERMLDSKRVYLPRVIEDNIEVVEVNKFSQYQVGAFGILEPSGQSDTSSHIDVVIVPLVACDKLRNRVGKGKGYYDRFFASHKDCYKIGLAFDFQVMNDVIEVESYDVKMDCIITNKEIF